MFQRFLNIVFICLLSVIGLSLYSQEGPSIQVASIFERSSLKWINHITVSDQDGIQTADYRDFRGNWQSLSVDPMCRKIMTWPVETSNRIRDVRAEDCLYGAGSFASGIPDSVTGYRSQWHYDSIHNDTEDAAFIVIEWLFEEMKGDLRIISVRVTSGNLTDENGEPLDPSDFSPTTGGFRGFVGKVKGSGTLEIILDPVGDLNIFVFDVYSDPPDNGLIKYLIGAIGGIILLMILILLFRRKI